MNGDCPRLLIDVRLLATTSDTPVEGLSHAQRIDEALVSTVRAAAASGFELLVPDDVRFGSLVALVFTEYAAQRPAEPGTEGDEDRPRLGLFSADVEQRRGVTGWVELLHKQGLLSRGGAPPDAEIDVRGALLLGDAPVEGSFASELIRRRPQLRLFGFRSCGVAEAFANRVRYVDDELGHKLAELRLLRRPINVDGPQVDESVSQARSELAPLALYAQRFIAELLGGRDSEPEPSPTTPPSLSPSPFAAVMPTLRRTH